MSKHSSATPAKPLVVFHGTAEGEGRTPRVLGAMFFSFLLNSMVLGLMLLGGAFFNFFNPNHVVATPDDPSIVDMPDEDQPPPNLTMDSVGLNPEDDLAYRSPRIDEVPIPGLTNMNEQAGISTGDSNTPIPLPPPPGEGGNIGTGGSEDNPLKNGPGRWGEPGGMRGKLVPGGLLGRSGATRLQLLREGGGNAMSEAAVALGLTFLAGHQNTDGRWSFNHFDQQGRCNCGGKGRSDNDIAATSMMILPFLGAGHTHKKSEKYTKQVDLGLRYLLMRQNRNGEFHPNMYAQGLATMAVCEAYAMTSDAALRNPAQRAIDYIADAQSNEGGWRYGRKQPGYDTSVSGWQLMALRSGQMAGLTVPSGALKNCKKWLDHASTADGGGYGYVANSMNDAHPGETPTLTSVGLLSREYLGWGPRNPGLVAGVGRLDRIGPQFGNMYYTYYASQVMHHVGGPAWSKWSPKMRDGLIALQDQGTDPQHMHQRGSWFNAADAISGGEGGRLMCTSLSILTLEVFYRHLPLYRQEVGGDKEVLTGN